MSGSPVPYCRHPEALWRRLAWAVVVLGPRADKPRAITGPGAEVWELLAEPTTLESAAEELAATHGATTADVRRDLETMLEVLLRDGAVEQRP